MSKSNKNSDKTNCQQSEQSEEALSSHNYSSSSSSDFETSRKHKLRRKSLRNVSFHYQALPMRVVGDDSVLIPDIPCTSRDLTLNSAHVIADSESDSEFHISNDSSNDEPANKAITFEGRPLAKTDLEFIRKQRKRKHRPKKILYKD